jgi:DNA-directed RNA polymerase subunit beta
VTDEVVYLSRRWRRPLHIAQANAELDAKGQGRAGLVPQGRRVHSGRRRRSTSSTSRPKQLVSVAAALIPFLENDDANRALMGSNMQRQAVPLIQAEAPLVGTGMEEVVARDSGVAIVAARPASSTRSTPRASSCAPPTMSARPSPGRHLQPAEVPALQPEHLHHQKPIVVKVGDHVKKGDIIADGPSTQTRRAGARPNVLVAFMPWNGYNFEDSILISERIVKRRRLHLDPHRGVRVMARDTKLGQEEITRDIPNVGEEALKNLDEAGIVYIGAEVKPGDILVGKVTPKGESPMTPEEKLLRAIFGEKAADVRDTSLRCRRACPARSSRCASSTAAASTRTSARWRSSATRSSVSPRTATTKRRSWSAASTAAPGMLV